jgi:general nucleoside transport system permease protein
VSDQVTPAGPGPAEPAVEAAAAGADHTGPGPSRARLTGNAIIQAIVEGSSPVVTVLALFLALVAGAVLIVLSNPRTQLPNGNFGPGVLHYWASFFHDPGAALSHTWMWISFSYSQMFEGSILNPATVSAAFHGGSVAAVFYPLSSTAAAATPLILTGLSVAIAFRAGLFNIGAAGQWVGGACVATWLGFGVSLPPVIHVVVCVLGGFVGGAVLGWLVGLLKARTGAHEVIVTIMANYVMYNLLQYLLSHPAMLQQPGQHNEIAPTIDNNANLPHVGGPPPQVGVGFLIAIAAAVAVAWLLARSTTGFQFRTVGASPSAARSAGIKVERVWILVMLLAGGLAGLAAAVVVLGTNTQLTFNSYGSYGTDGITVALLGKAKPLGVVLAGLLFGALQSGGAFVEGATLGQIPGDIFQVLEGVIVLFVAAPPLIRAVFRLRAASGGGMAAVAKGWNG